MCAIASAHFKSAVWPEVTYISFFEMECKRPNPLLYFYERANERGSHLNWVPFTLTVYYHNKRSHSSRYDM